MFDAEQCSMPGNVNAPALSCTVASCTVASSYPGSLSDPRCLALGPHLAGTVKEYHISQRQSKTRALEQIPEFARLTVSAAPLFLFLCGKLSIMPAFPSN